MKSRDEIISFHVWKHGVATNILLTKSKNTESILNTKDLCHEIKNNPGEIKSKLKNDERQEHPESKAWRQGKFSFS